jgi:hypothetical protein
LMTYQVSTNSIAQPTVLVDPATGEPYSASGGGSSGLTDAQLRASPVSVSGTVAITAAQLPATLGIKTAANSVSIAPASDASFAVTGTFFQATQPVSGTVAATQSGTWNITNISGTISLPTGAATAAKQPALGTAGASSPDVITVQGIASGTPQPVIGAVASGGANGQNPVKVGARYNATLPTVSDGQGVDNQATAKGALIISLYTVAGVEVPFPAALAANGGLKVEGIAGGVAQPVLGPMTSAEFLGNLRSGTGTKTSVNSGTSSVTILASNANRKGATVFNTDANALYLDLSGGTASSTSFTVSVATNAYYEVPFGYTASITGIWAADGAGAALVTEFT